MYGFGYGLTIRRSSTSVLEVEAWLAATRLSGAEMALTFDQQKYGIRDPVTGLAQWAQLGGISTFTRPSTAGRWPASGPYEMVGNNVLRYDHDPVTRAPLGVRIEGAQSPVSVWTTDFSANSPKWGNATAFPGGLVDRPSIFAGGVAAEHYGPSSQGRAQNYTLAPNTDYHIEVIVETTPSLPTYFFFGLYRGGFLGSLNYVWATGGYNSGGGVISEPVVEALGIGPSGGQVRRMSCVVNSGAGGATTFLVYPCGSAGSAAGQSCILHYACCTPGTTPGSPIIVGASAVTRAAERLHLDLPFDPATEGVTFLWDGVLPRTPSGEPVALDFASPSGAIDRLQLYNTTSGFGVIGALAAGTWAPTPGWRTFVAGARRRVVARLTPATLSLSQNGDAVTTAALTGAIPSGMTRLDIGNFQGGNQWRGTISRVAIWKGTPFSDAQMRELSAL